MPVSLRHGRSTFIRKMACMERKILRVCVCVCVCVCVGDRMAIKQLGLKVRVWEPSHSANGGQG